MARKEFLVTLQIEKQIHKRVFAEDEAQAKRMVKDTTRTTNISRNDVKMITASEIITTP